MPTPLSNQIIRRRHLGFSIVEIMVGIVISMLAVLVIMQVYTVFEGRKRTATGGSDAQTNGGLALYTLERDVRLAGFGLSLPQALGCTVNASYNGGAPPASSPLAPPFTLNPVVIIKGANGLPDTIRLLYSSKGNFSVPARVITNHPAQATNFFLNTTLGIAVNDMMIAFEPGLDCTLLQVTGIPNGTVQIHHQNTSPWDPPGGQNIFPPGGYSTKAMLFNLGSLIVHTYSLDAGNNLQLANFLSQSNTNDIQALFPNIVNLQAQYGFDTRAGTQSDARVDTWSDTMIDADKNGTVGNGGDVARIYAIRMAVVARSALMEKPNANGKCDFYTGAKPLFKKPAWTAADPATGTLKSTEIEVGKTPDGTAIADWECYRYKTFETIVPLRNLIWSKS